MVQMGDRSFKIENLIDAVAVLAIRSVHAAEIEAAHGVALVAKDPKERVDERGIH